MACQVVSRQPFKKRFRKPAPEIDEDTVRKEKSVKKKKEAKVGNDETGATAYKEAEALAYREKGILGHEVGAHARTAIGAEAHFEAKKKKKGFTGKVNADAYAELSAEAKAEAYAKYIGLKAQAEANAQAIAYAGADASLVHDKTGLGAYAEAGAETKLLADAYGRIGLGVTGPSLFSEGSIGAEATASTQAGLKIKRVKTGVGAEARAFGGAKARVHGSLGVTDLGVGVDAFAGARGEVQGNVRVGNVKAGAGVVGYAGAGAHAAFGSKYRDNKLLVRAELGGAVGVGGGLKGEVEIDMEPVYDAAMKAGKYALKNGKKGAKASYRAVKNGAHGTKRVAGKIVSKVKRRNREETPDDQLVYTKNPLFAHNSQL